MAMLLFTFSNMSPRDLRFHPLHCVMLAVQIGGSLLAYALISPWNPVIAQCASLCLLTPTGTAAATITGHAGRECGLHRGLHLHRQFRRGVRRASDYSPHRARACGHALPFVHAFRVFQGVAPTMLRSAGPRLGHAAVHARPQRRGHPVQFPVLLSLGAHDHDPHRQHFRHAARSRRKGLRHGSRRRATGILICAVQFAVGKGVGARYHRRIATGQALAQKNLMLAMWLAFQYLDPLTAVCLAAYSIFQNLFNATQIWLKGRSDERIRRRLHAYHERKHARMDGTGIPPRVPDGVPDMTESEENALDALPLRIAREVERGKSPSPPGAERSE